MKFERAALVDPFDTTDAQTPAQKKVMIAGSNDFYGAHSLETFSSASGLTYTHEDAQGFLCYPTSFQGANFWLRDAGVQVWAYEEAYDNWQDTFGMDAVMVFYHSGHGAMDGNGIFQIPLGAKWDSRDWAFSNRMAFANEELRYLFWSTCYSLRVSGHDNPVRTWWNPNKGGLRMMFGYETTSIDDRNYGTYFWQEWRNGKTFARAFLDASWRISHNQVPVVMAVGANANDAINRLNNERYFSRAPVTKGWYQWQWIGALPSRSFIPRTDIPQRLDGLTLGNRYANDERIVRIARELGATQKDSETLLFDADGSRTITSKDVQVNVNREGALNLHFGKANPWNTSLLNEDEAVGIARSFINDLGLSNGIELALGNLRHRFMSGGTLEGSGTLDEPSAVETIIQFRQVHGGIQSINSDHGLIAVSIDNDRHIVNVYDSTRSVLGEVGSRTSDNPPGGYTETQFQRKIGRLAANGDGTASILREAVGYDMSGSIGTVVHQKDIEVGYGENLRKRYKVRVPIE